MGCDNEVLPVDGELDFPLKCRLTALFRCILHCHWVAGRMDLVMVQVQVYRDLSDVFGADLIDSNLVIEGECDVSIISRHHYG